jgi:uncharacterized RDD family membrane protein YckC
MAVGGGLPPDAYTPWLTRVLAYLIDGVGPAILGVIFLVLFLASTGVECRPVHSQYDHGGQYCEATGPGGLTWVLMLVLWLAAIAFVVWNYGYKQGTTGSSIGKGVMKFKVVGEATGQPIGFGMSIVRQLAHVVDSAICSIGYLFPLWDPKRQTLADKIMKTVCLPV